MPDPTEILTDWKAKTDAATEGPWTWDGDSFDDADQESCPHGTEWTDHGPDLRAAGEGVITSWGYDASGLHIETADAEFIAMSRSAFPRLLAAVESVLGLHTPFEAEGVRPPACKACIYPHPCPTVRAITDALGGGDDE